VGSPSPRRLAWLALLGIAALMVLPSGSVPSTPRPAPAAAPSPSLPGADRATSGPLTAPATAPPTFSRPHDGWIQFQGDPERDGVSPDAAPVTSAVAWNATLPTGAFGSTPVTAGLVTNAGLLYVASGDDDVYAYDQTNGTLAWAYATNGPIESTPVVHHGLLLVGTTSEDIFELNATTGAYVGTVHLGGPDNTTSPIAIGGNVVAPCKARNICEFNISTGGEVWNQTVGALSTTPAYDPTTGDFIVGTTTGTIWAIGSGGTKLWGYTVPGGAGISASPIVGTVNGITQRMVFVFASFSTSSAALFAFNETTMTYGGHPLYADYNIPDGITSSGILTSTELVAPSSGGTVLAFDPANGAGITPWNPYPWAANSNPLYASIVDAQGTLLVGTQGTGSQGAGGGELAFVSATTGNEVTGLAADPMPDPIVSAPAVDSSAIFVADRDGLVQALGPAAPGPVGNLAATPGNGSMSVSWTAPSQQGGIGVAYYEIEGIPQTAGIRVVFDNISSPTTTTTVPGLANGVTYDVYVRANNSEGFSPPIEAKATPGAPPYPPRDVSDRVSQAFFHVSWQPPAAGDTGGFPIASYTVQYWNASETPARPHTNVSVTSGTEWNAAHVPDGVEMFAEVAAVTSEGPSIFSGIVSGSPYLADGILNLSVSPSAVWGSVSISITGVSSIPYVSENGTARVSVVPNGPGGIVSLWVNASAPGYLPFDAFVPVSSGNTTSVLVNLTASQSNNVLLTPFQWEVVTIVLAALLLIGIIVGGLRYRRLAAIAGGGEEEEEGEEEGISDERARALLAGGSAPPGGSFAASGSGTGEEGGEQPLSSEEEMGSGPLEGSPGAEGASAEEEAAPEEEEEPGGFFARRRAAKETLKNTEEDTGDGTDGQT
jgi:outer membrane protein assembly factor BamB